MGQFVVNRSHTAKAATEEQTAHLASGATKPDIYYIILDGYSRDDTLQDFFSYDNTPFLKALEDMGFYVARCSQSNYAQTQLSLLVISKHDLPAVHRSDLRRPWEHQPRRSAWHDPQQRCA